MGSAISSQTSPALPSPQAERQITYSPALTLVPTYECFNHCQYCNFRVAPGTDHWMTLSQADSQLSWAQGQGVIEILILSGEVHPASRRRQQWFDHIYGLCQRALAHGFLPHSNVGPLRYEEMAALKSVNVSMGLMLEQITPSLLTGVHRHAPSKVPEVRLQQLEWAGQLHIPFTTGLLLGIGETPDDRRATLQAIADCHHRWGHIQEVILQPHQPGRRQAQAAPGCSIQELLMTLEQACQILPQEITLQVPPNLLLSSDHLLSAIALGARDLGGLVPLDEVNPDYPHESVTHIQERLKSAGWQLQPRLPIYPRYDHWLPTRLRQQVEEWRQQLDSGR